MVSALALMGGAPVAVRIGMVEQGLVESCFVTGEVREIYPDQTLHFRSRICCPKGSS